MGWLIATGFATAVDNKLGFAGAGLYELFWMFLAAGFAVALGALACLLFRSENWRAAALAFAIALLMSPLAYFLVRAPIGWSPIANFRLAPPFVLVLSMFSAAPLTEEPAKWLAAAVPMVRRAIRSQPVTMALVVGVGFSIGEEIPTVVAVGFSIGEEIRKILIVWGPAPLGIFNPFGWFLHGAFVALPFAAFARGGSFFLGGLAGMALHFFLNFPTLLQRLDVFGRDVFGCGTDWDWVIGFVVACALMLCWLARRPSTASPPP